MRARLHKIMKFGAKKWTADFRVRHNVYVCCFLAFVCTNKCNKVTVMAMKIVSFIIVFCLFSLAHGALFRSKRGCSICGRKTDKSRLFVHTPVAGDVCQTFNVKKEAAQSLQLCSACARAVRRYKTTGVKATKVSTIT